MKYFGISLAFLVVLVSCEAFSFRSRAKDECVDGKSCTPDCLGVRYCTNGQYVDINCKTQSGGRYNYCNSFDGSCVDSEATCVENGDKKCPLGAGVFPDVLNCHRYYECSNDLYRVNYGCDADEVYDPVKEHCSLDVPCIDFSPSGVCNGSTPRLIAHPLFPYYYLICTAGIPILERCPYTKDYLFDETMAKCLFTCSQNGKFQDYEDDTHSWYFECVYHDGEYVQTHRRCERDNIFDPVSQTCKRATTTTTEVPPVYLMF